MIKLSEESVDRPRSASGWLTFLIRCFSRRIGIPPPTAFYRAGLGPPVFLKRVQIFRIEFRQNYLSERDLYSAFKVLTPESGARDIIARPASKVNPWSAISRASAPFDPPAPSLFSWVRKFGGYT
jgi:hypothetical protein